MSRLATYQCDGPTCLAMAEGAEDDDDVIQDGWFVIEFQADEEDRTAHLCSAACVVAWASEDLK